MELLVVLAILSLLMGIAVGTFGRSVPFRDLARNELLDKLRQARLFAVAEQAPAAVVLDPGDDENWPTVTALGRKTVGMWHLEGTDLDGFPDAAVGAGLEDVPQGALGHAVHLAADEESWLDFGHAPSFDATRGLGVELFLRLDDLRTRELASKGDGFLLAMDGAGALTLSVSTRLKDAAGRWTNATHVLDSDGPVLLAGRWTKVAASFDGQALRQYVDDVLVGELRLPKWQDLVPAVQSSVMLGSLAAPFGGAVDEFRWAVYVAEVSEPLQSVRLLGQERVVRFAPGGELDRSFHPGPAELGIVTEGGAEAWVGVGLLGDVN